MPQPGVTKPVSFPRPGGKSLAELRKGFGPGPVLSPSVSILDPGRNRFGFGLFDRARRQIAEAPAALYFAPAAGGKVSGPFPARFEWLKVKPQFQSRNVAEDPDAARSLYVADLKFPKSGRYEILGAVRLDDRLVAASRVQVEVYRKEPVPKVGDPAPEIDTPTKASVGGDVAKIDTRVPPDDMHEVDYADALGERPIVLLLATPALCQSRVCGPVVDIAQQVKASYKGDAAFIHMEIYKDNEIKPGCLEGRRPLSDCYRPQVLAFKVATEPWLFTIDRQGRVAARIEGAFSESELEKAVHAASRD